MTGHLVQLHLLLARHRVAILCGLLLVVAAALYFGRRLKLNEDFTDILPMSAPAIAEQITALKRVRQADRLYIDVATTDPTAAPPAEAAARLAAALRQIPHLADLRDEIALEELGIAYEELQSRLPDLLDAASLRALEPLLTSDALERRLAWLKQAMIQPQGMMFKNAARIDPAGIGDPISTHLRALQAGTGDARIVDGRITSADGRHVLLYATPDFPPSATAKSARLIPAVLQAARSIESQFPPGALKISITGAHRATLDNALMIRADTTITSFLATLAIAALILFACRRRLLALLALAPVIFGALGATLFFCLTGDIVSAVALGCGSMLIGVTVDFGVYIVYTLDDAAPADRPELARIIAGLCPALLFGALTTMAAFFIMLFSPISGHRQLGIFGLIGVGLAAAFAMLILPLFIPVQRSGGNARPLPLTTLLQRVFDWRTRNSRLMLPLLALLTLACLFGLTRLKFDGDLARLNGVTTATRQDEAIVRKTWGQALSLTTIVVDGATREEALLKNERVRAVLEKLRSRDVLESFSSLAPLFPSALKEAQNRRDWQAFWTADRQAEVRGSLGAAAARLGFRADAFTPFLEKIAAPATVAPGTNSALQRLTADFWSARDGRVFLTTLVKVGDLERFQRLRAAVQAAVPEAALLNKSALSDEVTKVAQRSLPVFGLLVAALNALLIYLLLGRVSLVLVTLLPMAAAVLWTLGILGLLGLPVDVANFIFVVFIVGVGGDYSLFIVLGELEPLRGCPERSASNGGAVTMTGLTSLLGTGVLVLARHPALFSVGFTALLGISFSLLAALFLVPLCVRWLAQDKPPQTAAPLAPKPLRGAIARLYRFQGPYVCQFVFWKMKTDPLFVAVERTAPPTGEILDLGCGFGIVAHWLTLAAPARRVRGIDFDTKKICVARATALANPRVTFEQGDLLERTEFPACDCALLCDVLHYFPREQKAAILKKTFTALRPGGRLVLRDAMAGDGSAHQVVAWAEKWAVRLGQNRTRHGLHFADEETHLALLREAGFQATEVRRDAGRGSNALLVALKAQR
ncbi:MAG TPA: MMPL family transporter [Verrucomicrobiae bacterium]|nr:MMPL family transporter [Verrucomicrobiae bacterium]